MVCWVAAAYLSVYEESVVNCNRHRDGTRRLTYKAPFSDGAASGTFANDPLVNTAELSVERVRAASNTGTAKQSLVEDCG